MTLDRCPLWVSQPVAGMARPSHPQSLPPSLHRHQSGCSEYCHCPTATPSSSQGKVQIPQLEELRPYAVRPPSRLAVSPSAQGPELSCLCLCQPELPSCPCPHHLWTPHLPQGTPLSSAPLCTPSSPGSSWMRPYETLGPVWGGGGRLQPRRGGGGEFSASLPLSAERSSEAGLIPFRAWLPSSGWCLGSRELNINA